MYKLLLYLTFVLMPPVLVAQARIRDTLLTSSASIETNKTVNKYIKTIHNNNNPAVFADLPGSIAAGASTFTYVAPSVPCSNFKFNMNAGSPSEAIDVATSGDFLFVAGHVLVNGNQNILVNKLDTSGKLIWSKAVGGIGAEQVRKAAPSHNGGLLVIGQTKTYDSKGEIYCFEIDNAGNLLWQRRFGLGSQYGDLGMDIIPTTDGGYALNGIINVVGNVADMIVIKLDASARIQWTRRFNAGKGEDGVGLLQHGNELIAAADMEQARGHYDFSITRLNLFNGEVVTSRKFTPAERGLFNPYLVKKASDDGFFVSGHTIAGSSYNEMHHTVLTLTNRLEIERTQLIRPAIQTNNYYTGFAPLPDGSFLGCGSPQNGNGYIYRVNPDNKVGFSYQFATNEGEQPFRLATTATRVVIGGKGEVNNRSGVFTAAISINGGNEGLCGSASAALQVTSPIYTTSDFIWTNVSEPQFGRIDADLAIATVVVEQIDLCRQLEMPDDKISCAGEPVILNAVAKPERNVRWAPALGLDQTDLLAPVARPERTTRYTLSITTADGCLLQDSVLVTVFPKPLISASNDTTICLGASIVLSAAGGGNYNWTPVAGLSNPSTDKPVAQPISSTEYVVQVSSPQGCSATDTVRVMVRVPAPFSLKASKNAVCAGTPVALFAEGGTIYSWLDQNTSSTSGNITVRPDSTTTYRVAINDQACNRDDTLSIVIESWKLPIAQAKASNEITCTNLQASLLASGGSRYLWTPAEGLSDPTIPNPIATPRETTTYSVAVTDERGCTAHVQTTVPVSFSGTSAMLLPNAFTPNGDGKNDCFGARSWGMMADFELQIFNRWGALIFSTQESSKCWNGTYRGVPQPAGVYLYRVKGNSPCGTANTKGTVVLIR